MQWIDHTPRADMAVAFRTRQQALRDSCQQHDVAQDAFDWLTPGNTIPGRIAALAARHPNRPAVCDEQTNLTYRELDELANRVANAILAVQGRASEIVALLVGHDAIGLSAALGVLKAGKAYVGFDDALPEQRCADILEDTGAALLVYDKAHEVQAMRLVGSSQRAIAVADLMDSPAHAPTLAPAPDIVAVLNYSSGSTGRPKGIVQSHHSMLAQAAGFASMCHLNSTDRVTNFGALAWAGTFWTLFGPLCFGASVASFDMRRSGVERLLIWLEQTGVTVVVGLAAVRQITAAASDRRFPGVRLVHLGGDTIYRRDIVACRQIFPQALVDAGMGATEAGRIAEWLINDEARIEQEVIPVGLPAPGMRILLLDERGDVAARGAPGEIAVQSSYLAPGYWQRPDLTAERFRTDGRHGAMPLYLTGDMGRWAENGMLLHLGRKDFQVKIRGYQVHTDAIEGLLLAQPGIAEACVVLRHDRFHHEQLVAFLVAAPGDAGQSDTLRTQLAAKLPEYMIPQRFVFLPALPKTPNQKVDRSRLPPLTATRPDLSTPLMAPSTALESRLAALWANLLELDRIGVDDDFLALGGDSMRAALIASRLIAEYGLDLPTSRLLAAATVRDLAATLSEYLASQPRPAAAMAIQHRSQPGPAPLSFAQEQLWFLDQLFPCQPTYNEPSAYRLTGALDAAALQWALNALVERHPALRTTFHAIGGVPQQVVDPVRAVPLPLVSVENDPKPLAAATAQFSTWIDAPFDLAHDLLVRATLFRLGAADHVLLLVNHHIASDAWSVRIRMVELTELYAAHVNGRAPQLPPLAIDYADYAVWQRAWLQGDRLERQLSYWRTQLAGLQSLALPAIFCPAPSASEQRQQGADIRFTVAPTVVEQLRELAHAQNATLYMVLLAAYAVLLARYAGQEDIALGTPSANRRHVEVEPLIGYFVNTLVMRIDLAGDPTFCTLLDRVRQMALAAYDHQDLPFEKLVAELRPERRLQQNPLVATLFQVDDRVPALPVVPGLTIARLHVPDGHAKFELECSIALEAKGLDGRLRYAVDRFDAATIASMAGQFQVLLAGIVATPECPIGRLPLLTAAERQQMLVTWNATATDYPRQACVQQLFEAQVALRPSATALVWGDSSLTYEELNLRANRIADCLRELGVGPGAAVGLCLRRSPAMIVALLAILKSGGAYIPLDPAHPSTRLALMVADARVEVILTETVLAPQLHDIGALLVFVDVEIAAARASDRKNPPCANTADDLAYIMYTSGSTGQPKGVEISHRAVARLVCNVDYVTLGPDEVLLHLAPLSFDASTFEIWGALLHGSRLVLAPDRLPDYSELEALIARWRVSILWLTAGLFNSIVEQRPQVLRGVRQLLTGGQALSVHHVRLAQEHLPDTTLINGYGPTENTTFTCCYRIPRPLPADLTAIPIGRPVPNTEVYILDRHLEPSPIGVVGELYASGDGLARGYLNCPELTTAQFIDHPFRWGERLYRTGDMARWRADGVIEIAGRRDRQVKIRGHRIEPGEVESVLLRHGAVQAAAVIAQHRGNDPQLIAYLVVDPAQRPTVEQLHSAVAGVLPNYMAPTTYVFVNAIPLTANGKLDVQALLEQPVQPAVTQRISPTPSDALEQQLVQIWQHVLDVRPVGVGDSFFDLGGHSLLAVKLLDQVERATGRRLPLTVLFETPTVAALAQALRDRAWTPNWSSLTPIQDGGARIPLFLAPPGGSSSLRLRHLVSHLGADQPVYAFHPIGLDDDQPPHSSVEEMAAHYLQELRRFRPDGPYLLGGMCFGAHVAAEMTCRLEAAGVPVLGLIVLDAGPPANGPGWQAPPPVERNLEHYLRRTQVYGPSKALGRACKLFVAAQLKRLAALLLARVSETEMRRQRILKAHHLAQRAYRARPFRAHLTLVENEQRAQSSVNLERWTAIAGSVESYVVPGTTHRKLLLEEPYVSQLAGLVRASLDRRNDM